jgi:hypothetical protein
VHSFKTTALAGAVWLALAGTSAQAAPAANPAPSTAEIQSLKETVETLRKQILELRGAQSSGTNALDRARVDELNRQVSDLKAQLQKLTEEAAKAKPSEEPQEGESDEALQARTPANKADIQGLRTDLENYKYDTARQLERNVPSVTRNTKIGGGVIIRYDTNNPKAQPSASSSGAGATAARANGFAAPSYTLNFAGTLYRDYEAGRNLTYRLAFASTNTTTVTSTSSVSTSGSTTTATGTKTANVATGTSFLNATDIYLRYSFQPASGNPEDPLGTITVGQQPIPFGQEAQALDVETRPVITNAGFVNGLGLGTRQTGLVVAGDLDPYVDFTSNYRAPSVTYAFGVFNGNGTNRADNNGYKDYVGRLVYTLPVDYASWLRQLQIGASYYRGYTSVTTATTNDISATTADQKGVYSRRGLDLNWTHLPYSISYEWAYGKNTLASSTTADPDGLQRSSGQYVNFGYTWGEQFLNSSKQQGKFDDFWPKSYQAFLRFDEWDPNRSGKAINDKIWVRTLGLNVFFAETSRLQINHLHTINQLGGATPTAAKPASANGWIVQLNTTF